MVYDWYYVLYCSNFSCDGVVNLVYRRFDCLMIVKK